MGAKDITAKAYFSDVNRFADVFNFKIYDGKSVIKPENLCELDTNGIALPYGDAKFQPMQKIRDTLKMYSAMKDEQAIYLILGIEAQTKVHYAMPVRNMLYDAMSYSQQVMKVAKARRETNVAATETEFLSGFGKNDFLIPVVTLTILLSADTWDAPRSIHEMLRPKNKEIMNLVSNYQLNLIVPGEMQDEDFDKFKTNLGAVMQFIKHQNDEDMAWIKNRKRFEEMDFESANFVKTFTRINIKIKKGEKFNMCKAWENSIKKAEIDGKKIGEKNNQTATIKAMKMLKDNIAPEEVSRSTGCDMAYVTQLKNMMVLA